MGSDVGQIFPTASLHRVDSISYALVCEKEISHMGKYNGNPALVCEKGFLSSMMYVKALWCDNDCCLNLCKNGHSQNYQILVFKTNYRLMQVKSISECSEHSEILSTFIQLPFVIKIFVLSIFEQPFYISFTAH